MLPLFTESPANLITAKSVTESKCAQECFQTAGCSGFSFSDSCSLSIGVMTSNDLNDVTIDPSVINGGRLNSDCQTNIKSEFAISAETYLQFGLFHINMVTPLENSLNNLLNKTLEKWVFTNDVDRSTAYFIEFFQEDPPEELGQSFQVRKK